MSGPTTVLLTPDIAVLLLAAAAIRAAQGLQAAYRDAAALGSAHSQQDAANQARQAAAATQGAQSLAARRQESEQRFTQLRELAGSLGASADLPPAPGTADPAALAAYIRAVDSLNDSLSALLAEHLPADSEAQARLDELAGPAQVDLKQQLDAYAGRQSAELLAHTRRLLNRIAHQGPLPESIAALVRELASPLTLERGEALLLELRRQINLRQADEVAAAQALVLEQSLKDLGYQVEDVAATLFVDGGVVHFRKPGWGQHLVRMRVDAKHQSANFNVIRAVAAGENGRSVLDHLAEDRWCAEFPALLQALQAKGLGLSVTRRLEAGELPVQLVHEDKLPRFAEDEETSHSAAPLQKALL